MLKPGRSIPLTVLIALAICFSGCKDTDPEVIATGQDLNYAPVELEYSWTYQVDSIFFDGFTLESDTFQFMVRNTVFDTIRDNLGRLAYVVLRERDTGTDWLADRQFTVVKTSDAFEVIDQDVRVVKMIFPVRDFQRWDGNAHNTMPAESFRYLSIDQPYQVLDSLYSQTVMVRERDYNNILEDFYTYSYFARNNGLVEYYNRHIERKNSKGEFIQGYITHYRLLESSL